MIARTLFSEEDDDDDDDDEEEGNKERIPFDGCVVPARRKKEKKNKGEERQ